MAGSAQGGGFNVNQAAAKGIQQAGMGASSEMGYRPRLLAHQAKLTCSSTLTRMSRKWLTNHWMI